MAIGFTNVPETMSMPLRSHRGTQRNHVPALYRDFAAAADVIAQGVERLNVRLMCRRQDGSGNCSAFPILVCNAARQKSCAAVPAVPKQPRAENHSRVSCKFD